VLKGEITLFTIVIPCLCLIYNQHILYTYPKVTILIIPRLCITHHPQTISLENTHPWIHIEIVLYTKGREPGGPLASKSRKEVHQQDGISLKILHSEAYQTALQKVTKIIPR
jgi:hypothetical protein